MKSAADALAAAFARHRKGDLAAAERIYRKVIKAQPGNADALYLLGALCLERGRTADAARHLKKAVSLVAGSGRRADPRWRLALGTALQRSGALESALAEYEAILRDDPESIDGMFCRATVLYELGRREQAIAEYEEILKRMPKHAEAANNLGVIHRDAGEPAAAVAAFRRAVAARPGYAEALYNLGNALADVGLAGEAVPALTAAADDRPDDLDLHLTLFDCLVQADRADVAERRARAFLAAHPGTAPAAAALGAALQYLGRGAEAKSQFLAAVAADPACSRAHQGLAEDPGEAGAEHHIRQIRAALSAASDEGPEAVGLHFALGRHLAAAGDHDGALESWVAGNKRKREGLARRGFSYSRDGMERRVATLCAAFPADSFGDAGGGTSRRPVFILGMPRSGTTLTEQILAGHPEVFGAGERGFVGQIAQKLYHGAGAPPEPLSHDALAAAADFYLAAIGRLNGTAARVTDKMPANFLHLGLIARVFPRARIIHCRRDPIDTCLSCFMQNFRAAHLSWTCDLADLGHYYCQYRRLMDYWRTVLPDGTMLEVDYEDTVADLESQARRLVEFVGLEWDDACLRFNETERAVVTASHSQVRRKLYGGSVGRWRRYGDGLQPLIEALSACRCGPETGA